MLGGRVGGRGVHVALARDPARGGHVDDDAAAAPRLAGHVPRAGLQAVVDPLLQPGTESQCNVVITDPAHQVDIVHGLPVLLPLHPRDVDQDVRLPKCVHAFLHNYLREICCKT